MTVDFAPKYNYLKFRSESRAAAERGEYFERPFELNVANGSAKYILNWLGLGYPGQVNPDPIEGCEDLFGEADPDAVLRALDALPHPSIMAIPGATVKIPNGPTVIMPGWDEERIARYVTSLKEIALEAKRRGVPVAWA